MEWYRSHIADNMKNNKRSEMYIQEALQIPRLERVNYTVSAMTKTTKGFTHDGNSFYYESHRTNE